MRRSLSGSCAALLVCLVACGQPEPPASLGAPAPGSPVVLVTVDTTRPDHLSVYGATDVETPTLQALADSGIAFDRAYSVAPLTLVAHSSLLTGLIPPRHGVRNNGTHALSDGPSTLAARLAEAGYATGAFVSAAVLEASYGLGRGFEVYDDDLSSSRERLPRMVPDRPGGVTVAAARAWLDGLDARPPFIWVHLYDPHAAYQPPPPFRERYRARPYDGEIAYMDSVIGELLAHPRLSGALTVVVGDHGESLGEHGEQTHGLLAYDSTLHIPLIMAWPGGPSGRRFGAEVGQVDLMPTLLGLLGLPAAAGLDGLDLSPALLGGGALPERELYAESYLPFYSYGWAKLRVLRGQGFKLIDGPRAELFNLRRDPRELTNLVARDPGPGADLRSHLSALTASPDDDTARVALDDEVAEQLRTLGYLVVGSGDGDSDTAQRLDPKDGLGVHVGLERARQLSSDRLFDLAARQLDAVLKQDPRNLAAWVELAEVQERAGQADAALASIEMALQLDPNYERLHLSRARLKARAGATEAALEEVTAVVERAPTSVAARLQEIGLLAQLGRGQDAAARTLEALREMPDRAGLRLARARYVELPRGDLQGAEVWARAALDEDAFLTGAWMTLGEVLERQGHADDALAVYIRGLERAPDAAGLHAALGRLLAARGDERAGAHLEEALRLADTFHADWHISLGAFYADQGRLDDAQAQYQRVLKAQPDHPAALNNQAIALYRLGRVAEAQTLLEGLVRSHPAYADAHTNLSAICVDQEAFAKAERHARLAVGLDPRATQAFNNLGLALVELGRAPEATAAYEQALALDGDYWPARHNLAVAQAAAGQLSQARASFEAVLLQAPGHVDSHLELARLLLAAGDTELARAHYRAALRASAGHPRAAEAQAGLDALSLGAPE